MYPSSQCAITLLIVSICMSTERTPLLSTPTYARCLRGSRFDSCRTFGICSSTRKNIQITRLCRCSGVFLHCRFGNVEDWSFENVDSSRFQRSLPWIQHSPLPCRRLQACLLQRDAHARMVAERRVHRSQVPAIPLRHLPPDRLRQRQCCEPTHQWAAPLAETEMRGAMPATALAMSDLLSMMSSKTNASMT